MKKILLMFLVATSFTFCNPSQQTNQTTSDSPRMVQDSTPVSTGTMTDTTATSDSTAVPDTSSISH